MASHFKQSGKGGSTRGAHARTGASDNAAKERSSSPKRADHKTSPSAESTEGWLALGRALSSAAPSATAGSVLAPTTEPAAQLQPLPTADTGGIVSSVSDDSPWSAPLPLDQYPQVPASAVPEVPAGSAVRGATFAERGSQNSSSGTTAGAQSAAHGSSPAVTGAFARLDPSVTGSFAAITPESLQPIAAPAATAADAPRPIGVDPSITGGFSRIAPDQAAHTVTRANATAAAQAARGRHGRHTPRRMRQDARPAAPSRQPRLRTDRRLVIVIALVAVLVTAVAGLFVYRALTSIPDTAAGASANSTAVQVSAEETINYAGATYALVPQNDGTHLLTSHPDGSESVINIAPIAGTPSQLIGYGGSIIIPESFADEHWDVIAYTPGDGSVVTQVIGSDGEPVHGNGSVVEATVVEADLVIVDSTGVTTTIPLA